MYYLALPFEGMHGEIISDCREILKCMYLHKTSSQQFSHFDLVLIADFEFAGFQKQKIIQLMLYGKIPRKKEPIATLRFTFTTLP